MPHAPMKQIKNICVYCGSGPGVDPVYVETAQALGEAMAKAGIGLVYGGGSLGLMGTIARTVLDSGGHVTGIIPEFLTTRERMLEDVQELIVTKDMHSRKALMFKHADAFVSLPGGVGTLEETVEMLTWSQLGQHNKPILLVNIKGFWEPLNSLFQHMRAEEFIREGLLLSYLLANNADDVIPMLQEAVAAAPDSKAEVGGLPVSKF